MGLFDKLRAELVDIVEWVDDSQHTLVWRFPRYQNEIKNGAQLIVRPGQQAVFVSGGKLADVFEPGTYTLETKNLPILSTLQGWKFGFNSPFKSEVYFVSTRQVTDLKWGTPNPIMLRDPDFGPIRLRAFGTYALRCTDARALLRELVGTDGAFETDEVVELLRSLIATQFAQLVGESKVAALDLAASYSDLSQQLRKAVQERIDDEYGLALPVLNIVNISFPPEVEKALDTRTKMGVLGNLQAYQQLQMAESLPLAAQNPGGLAAAGAGFGMGMAFMNQTMAPAMGAAMPPPPPPQPMWHVTANGATQGPFTQAQLQQAIAQGQVPPDTLVWTNGMAQWTPAREVPQLATSVSPPPPPPPPPPPTPK